MSFYSKSLPHLFQPLPSAAWSRFLQPSWAGAYRNFHGDMQNYAMLFRSSITIDTVKFTVRPKKWANFLASLGFQVSYG